MTVTRRVLVAGALAAAGTAIIHPAVAREARPLSGCMMSPLEKFMRIRSSRAGRPTFWSYSGQLLGRTGDTPLQPLFSIIGASQTIANWRDDGSIAYEMVEAGYYGHLVNGTIGDEPVKNPLTGKMVQPEPYLSRQKIVFTQDLRVLPNPPLSSDRGLFNGSITPPDEKGGRIWMEERLLGMLHETAESSRRVFNSMASFEASSSDVCGPGVFVAATMQYTTLNSFRPWMNMGNATGNIMSRLNAVKLEKWSKVNYAVRERIETDHPRIFGDV